MLIWETTLGDISLISKNTFLNHNHFSWQNNNKSTENIIKMVYSYLYIFTVLFIIDRFNAKFVISLTTDVTNWVHMSRNIQTTRKMLKVRKVTQKWVKWMLSQFSHLTSVGSTLVKRHVKTFAPYPQWKSRQESVTFSRWRNNLVNLSKDHNANEISFRKCLVQWTTCCQTPRTF